MNDLDDLSDLESSLSGFQNAVVSFWILYWEIESDYSLSWFSLKHFTRCFLVPFVFHRLIDHVTVTKFLMEFEDGKDSSYSFVVWSSRKTFSWTEVGWDRANI